MDPINLLIYVFSLMVLIYLSGRFSGAETALTSLGEIDLVQMRFKKTRNVVYIEKLMKDMDRTIITILIGNNLVNILASSISTLLFYELLGNLGVSISVGVLTLLLLIFGEITPKAYALKKNRRIASRSAKIIFSLSVVLSPLISVLKMLSRQLIRLRGGSVSKDDFHIQELNIKHLADKGADTGEIKDIEKDIIHRVFKFGDMKVRDVMIPAKDVKYLDRKMSVIEAKREMVYSGYTRLPVIDKEKLTVLGVIYTKDLLNRMEKKVKNFMRSAFIVYPEEEITTVFAKMKNNRVHQAIVSDHDRRFLGVITLEDILEELVGEIYDEFDFEEGEEPVDEPVEEEKAVEEPGNAQLIDRGEKEGTGDNGDQGGEGGDRDGTAKGSGAMVSEEAAVVTEIEVPEPTEEDGPQRSRRSTMVESFVEVLGIERDVGEKLYSAGYWSLGEVGEAEPEDLRIVGGISPTMARKICEKVRRQRLDEA